MSDTGAILIPFSFVFFLQSIKFDIDPLRVSIQVDPFVLLQEYIAGKWEMPCYRR